ncbi:hypothetical protein [Acinetobacter seifertii]|uniref:hypothetical protein n=1 Tax=Acinetobacter seifertii TaxID=1530123 RepID=UPI001CC27B95|nr:hypothetical protein [Acinetobacter seifertii]
MTLGKPVAIKLLLKLASSIKTVKQNSSSGSFDLLNSIGLKVISGVLKGRVKLEVRHKPPN